jgi:hypothetical protein
MESWSGGLPNPNPTLQRSNFLFFLRRSEPFWPATVFLGVRRDHLEWVGVFRAEITAGFKARGGQSAGLFVCRFSRCRPRVDAKPSVVYKSQPLCRRRKNIYRFRAKGYVYC